MEKKSLSVLGIALVLLGALALPFTFWGPILGWSWGPWRLWPILVIGAGLLFVMPPFLSHGRRRLGGLLIPGVPILITGVLLLFTSTFNTWSAWSWLWPLEILGVAAAFLLAGVFLDCIWLLLPAMIIGANGLLCQLCALTGWWVSWSVLWIIEPLSVGLGLVIISARKRSPKLLRAGLIVCAVAAFCLVLMTSIMSTHWKFLGMLGPIVLVALGFLFLLQGGLRRPTPGATSEN